MSAVLTGDLRSETKSYQRDKNHNSKWAKGARAAPGKKCTLHYGFEQTACSECAARPVVRDINIKYTPHFYDRNLTRKNALARKAFRNEIEEATDGPVVFGYDPSSDEEINEASVAPEPDRDITYSFDAPFGPGQGRDILGDAVTQAVKRFENKQTEQLIKTEYDLVLDGKDHDMVNATDEDGFEVVDYSHLE